VAAQFFAPSLVDKALLLELTDKIIKINALDHPGVGGADDRNWAKGIPSYEINKIDFVLMARFIPKYVKFPIFSIGFLSTNPSFNARLNTALNIVK